MILEDQLISVCPDFQSECVGSKCAAFGSDMQMITNVTPLLSKLNYQFEEAIPLGLSVNIQFCRKYNKFLNSESLNLFNMLGTDFRNEIELEENEENE